MSPFQTRINVWVKRKITSTIWAKIDKCWQSLNFVNTFVWLKSKLQTNLCLFVHCNSFSKISTCRLFFSDMLLWLFTQSPVSKDLNKKWKADNQLVHVWCQCYHGDASIHKGINTFLRSKGWRTFDILQVFTGLLCVHWDCIVRVEVMLPATTFIKWIGKKIDLHIM